jgi:hypothetical protein
MHYLAFPSVNGHDWGLSLSVDFCKKNENPVLQSNIRDAWRGSGSSGFFGFFGFFGFAQQDKQDKPNKLDRLPLNRPPLTQGSHIVSGVIDTFPILK